MITLEILRNPNCLKESLRQNLRTHDQDKATNNIQLFLLPKMCRWVYNCPVSLLEPSLECIKLARFTVSISSLKNVKQMSNYIHAGLSLHNTKIVISTNTVYLIQNSRQFSENFTDSPSKKFAKNFQRKIRKFQKQVFRTFWIIFRFPKNIRKPCQIL